MYCKCTVVSTAMSPLLHFLAPLYTVLFCLPHTVLFFSSPPPSLHTVLFLSPSPPPPRPLCAGGVQMKERAFKPGQLSEDLRAALGMDEELSPPPGSSTCRRVGAHV